MSRKQALEQGDGPRLQSFRQNGVVRVREDFADNLPCLTELHIFFVDKDALKFGHGDSRMGVIQLNGHELGQGRVGKIKLLEPSKDVLQRGGAPEVLLLQSEFLALVGVIVRVKDSSDGLGGRRGSNGFFVVTGIERLNTKTCQYTQGMDLWAC